MPDEHLVEIFKTHQIRGGVDLTFTISKIVDTRYYRLSVGDPTQRDASVDLTFDSLTDMFTAVQTHNAGDQDRPEAKLERQGGPHEGYPGGYGRVRDLGEFPSEPDGDDGHGGIDG